MKMNAIFSYKNKRTINELERKIKKAFFVSSNIKKIHNELKLSPFQ
jgi:hypothetical protein